MSTRLASAEGQGANDLGKIGLHDPTQCPGAASSRDYVRIERALQFLARNAQRQPSLAECAGVVGLSQTHFQKLFTRFAGISPKQFLQALALDAGKRALDAERSVLDAALDAGLSGPGRLHDLLLGVEAVTPGAYKRRGLGVDVSFGYHDTPFGECLLLSTEHGVSGLRFVVEGDRQRALDEARARLPRARYTSDPGATQPLVDAIFRPGPRAHGAACGGLKLYLHGTRFQLKVWQALLDLPCGALTTYSHIAARIDAPRAARAVGLAVGANPIGYLIPCHRVLRKSGGVGGYHWGEGRKIAILAREQGVLLAQDRIRSA